MAEPDEKFPPEVTADPGPAPPLLPNSSAGKNPESTVTVAEPVSMASSLPQRKDVKTLRKKALSEVCSFLHPKEGPEMSAKDVLLYFNSQGQRMTMELVVKAEELWNGQIINHETLAWDAEADDYLHDKYWLSPEELSMEVAGKREKEISMETVATAYGQGVAREALTLYDGYVMVGRTVFPTLEQYAFEHHMTIEEFLRLKPHELIWQALEKYDHILEVEAENALLRRQLIYWRNQSLPYVRLRQARKDRVEALMLGLHIKELGGDPTRLLAKIGEEIAQSVSS